MHVNPLSIPCAQVLKDMRGVDDVSVELTEIRENAREAREESLHDSAFGISF